MDRISEGASAEVLCVCDKATISMDNSSVLKFLAQMNSCGAILVLELI